MNEQKLIFCLAEGVELLPTLQSLGIPDRSAKRNLDIVAQVRSFRKDNPTGDRLFPNDEDLFINVLYPRKSYHEKRLYRVYTLQSDISDIQVYYTAMRQSPQIEFVQFNEENILYNVPNDPLFNEQWALAMIQCQSAWNYSIGKDIVVAVVDSGVDYNHPDIAGNMWRDRNGNCGVDITDSGNTPMDCQVHGTHVAGIIAASTNNSIGIAGVAPGAKIMAIKVFSNATPNIANDLALAEGIYASVKLGANIINNSWGPTDPRISNPLIEATIDYAVSEHVIVIFAAGNKGEDASNYAPVTHPGVITVGSVDNAKRRAPYSNFGNRVSIAAPGGYGGNSATAILSLQAKDPNGYLALSGTSMAAPYVSGVVALMMSRNLTFDFEKAKYFLNRYGDPIDTDRPIGKLLNAYRAVNNVDSPPPIDRILVVFHLTTDDKDTPEEIQITVRYSGNIIGQDSFGRGTKWNDPGTYPCLVAVSPFSYNDIDNISIQIFKTPEGSSSGNGMEGEIEIRFLGQTGFERTVCQIASRRYGDNNPYDVTFEMALRTTYGYRFVWEEVIHPD